MGRHIKWDDTGFIFWYHQGKIKKLNLVQKVGNPRTAQKENLKTFEKVFERDKLLRHWF